MRKQYNKRMIYKQQFNIQHQTNFEFSPSLFFLNFTYKQISNDTVNNAIDKPSNRHFNQKINVFFCPCLNNTRQR